MNQKVLAIALLFMGLSLSGCTAVEQADAIVEKQMQIKSGVNEDPAYKQFQEFQADGKLDGDGYYTSEVDESAINPDFVHVSFATNNNLEIEYYSDQEHLQKIDTEACFVSPGSDIYADVSVDEDVYTSEYGFSGFRIVEYKDDNTRTIHDDMAGNSSEEGHVIHIPENLTGAELSIEPLGQYQMRKINLKDYYSDEDGSTHDLDGVWSVNDKDIQGDSIELNPVSSYIISYRFDSDEFFYLNSSPTCYYNNNDDGVVIFDQRSATDETQDYEIELHQYFDLALVSDRNRAVIVNGESEQSVKANNEVVLKKLKYGDKVVLETNEEWPALENNRDIILESSERTSKGYYKYILIIPDKNWAFLFDPNDYTYEHGTIQFSCFGAEVTGPLPLEKGRKISYKQKETDEGYWLAGEDNYIIVTDEEETKQKLSEIHFTPLVSVEVSLPQPEYGGKINYSLEGTPTKENRITTYSGAEISMSFQPWEGWKCKYKDGTVYKASDAESQIVQFDGHSVNTVFSEDEQHKPTLNFILDKSVGTDMKFKISAGGNYSSSVENYGGGWQITDLFNNNQYDLISNEQTLIKDQKIGTEKGIEIDVSNRAIPTGKAVRLVVEKTLQNGDKSVEQFYQEGITNAIIPVEIYPVGSNAKAKEWYRSISITVAVVDVEKFAEKEALANTSLIVKNKDTGKVLKAGDAVENSQELLVSLTPDPGYYIMGPKVKNDSYQTNMKYADFVKDFSNTLAKYSAAKYYSIVLDDSDSFAKYTYSLDGNTVKGRVNVKEGQKLKLSYEITDDKHRLKEATGGFLIFGKSDKKAEKTISISSEMDGKTITKADFNIETIEGE